MSLLSAEEHGAKNNSYVWKIVGLQNPDYMRLDETKTKITGGFYFHVFESVQQKLKFRYSIVKPIPEDFGRRSKNGSWTGLLAKLVNKEADMSLIALFLTANNFAIMEVTSPLMFQPIVFVIKGPERISNWISIIKPFGLEMWIAIVSTVFIFGLVLHKVVERDFVADEVGIFWPRSRVFWNLFCTFVYQGTNLNNVKRFGSRLLFSIWLLSVVVLMGSYSGTLMSFMSYPLTESVPKSFDELAIAVKNGEYSCGVIGKSVLWTYIENSKSIRDKVFKDHIKRHSNFLSFSAARERVKKERFAVIYSEYGIRKLIDNDPHAYIISSDDLTQFIQPYAVRKGFPFKKELSKTVIRLFEAGIVERKDYSETTKLLKYSEFQALQLSDIISPMILLSIGLLLALMCLFVELFQQLRITIIY
ncbi:probable glutamate receptor [Centruroides sculpturatus]|uniref:probable glutamate receptor n=1 Tax=Centruroides sculpturatus TaxID=218467 RepID=UPI000C6CFBA2|nr:probable glutamate receptor [Centruroides sculpturatus]